MNRLTHILLAATLYIATGWVGLHISLSPSYGTVIWLATGVAFASLVFIGNHCWLGVVLGSFVVHSTFVGNVADLWSGNIYHWLVPSIIALGSGLQALLGATIVQRYTSPPWKIDRLREFVVIGFLVGPVTCMLAASIGNVVIFLAGKVSINALSYNWLTWWIGDTLSVLIFTPMCFYIQREHFWRSLIENLPTILYVKDARTSNILQINKAGKSLLGLSKRDIINHPYKTFFKQKKSGWLKSSIFSVVTQKSGIRKFIEIVQAQNQERMLSTSEMPLINKDNQVIHYICLSEDITDKVQQDEEISQLTKDIIEASRKAGMADVATEILHNVGNVLNSMGVSIEVLKDETQTSRATTLAAINQKFEYLYKKYRHVLEKEDYEKVKLLLQLLTKLEEFLRDTEQRQRVELECLFNNVIHVKNIIQRQQAYAKNQSLLEWLNVNHLITETLEMIQYSYKKKNIKIVQDFSILPDIKIDRHQFVQIMINLFNNAEDAMLMSNKENKILMVKTELEDKWIKISVIDNGIGITVKDSDNMFRQGFTTKEKGHGFGLHSSINAAMKMKGKLEFYSKGQGKGTTFCLYLPCDALKKAEVS